ncbi:uncharacterized protein LOC126753570 [Bactrocera neohumeralis]|nr:uncharacterized protein LOC120769610 [Bactrocera tryoni]XP_050321070.1 uncharacterized protein LOC126753570 [Bactrocera neohumeralis]
MWSKKIFSQYIKIQSSFKSSKEMAANQFYENRFTNFHKNHIKLFAVYMKTANLMQNSNVLKRSL